MRIWLIKNYSKIIRKFKKKKSVATFFSADLIDSLLISRFNKGICFLLCFIDTFSKYAWVNILKDKRDITIINTFQKILNESNRKPNKIWIDKGNEIIFAE